MISQYKTTLRAHILAARDRLPPAVHARASAVITQRLASQPTFIHAGCVLAFYPYGSEWDATLFIKGVFARKKRMILPRRVENSRALDLYEIHDLQEDTELVGKIREPLLTCKKVELSEIDWILTPGVAFTMGGDRLGQGAGYFDRLLARVSSPTFVAAGAFDMQIVDSFPIESHDKKVRFIAVGPT